jgi:hypothetical protein
MRYFTYPWQEGEFENLVSQSHQYSYKKEERFIGPLIPFLGGVLIGGLFLPRPNPIPPYGPVYPVQPIPYVQPVPYVNEVPTYSTPVNHSLNK